MKGSLKIHKGVGILLRYIRTPMKNDFKEFFEELKDCYIKEKQDFNWNWNLVSDDLKGVEDFVYYIAFNLSKNILHGPLPNHIHTRMVLEKNNWSKKYIEYLEGK
jgi:hypothetical protein